MLVVFSDLHLHNYRRFGNPDERLSHFDQCLVLILKRAIQEKAKAVLFCGDLVEKHGTVSAQVLSLLTRRFKQFEKTNIPFIAISGNHDIATRSEYGQEVHTVLDYLDQTMTNFHLIDNSFIDIPGYRINGIRYMSSKESVDKQLAEVELSPHYENILLMHNTPPNENTMIQPDIDIYNPDIQQFDIIFNGHIHKRQSEGKFHTVGNPIQKDAADAGEDKGFYLYKNKKLTFVSTANYLPPIIISETEGEEGELVIQVPPKMELEDIQVIDFTNYDTMFSEFLKATDTGQLNKDRLQGTIKEYL